MPPSGYSSFEALTETFTMKIELDLSSEYGIMFLHDQVIEPTLPEKAGRDPVMCTMDCLVFNVLSYVDGDAKIIMSDNKEGLSNYPEYFAGPISCPSGAISLCDHNGFAYASFPLKGDFAQVSLKMSEASNPDIVELLIENAATF
jgi:hypothetical protein